MKLGPMWSRPMPWKERRSKNSSNMVVASFLLEGFVIWCGYQRRESKTGVGERLGIGECGSGLLAWNEVSRGPGGSLILSPWR